MRTLYVTFLNTPNQAETLLHSLERAAAGISLHVNAHKTEYMCYNQTGNITTLGGASLRVVDRQRLYRYCYMDALHGR